MRANNEIFLAGIKVCRYNHCCYLHTSLLSGRYTKNKSILICFTTFVSQYYYWTNTTICRRLFLVKKEIISLNLLAHIQYLIVLLHIKKNYKFKFTCTYSIFNCTTTYDIIEVILSGRQVTHQAAHSKY